MMPIARIARRRARARHEVRRIAQLTHKAQARSLARDRTPALRFVSGYHGAPDRDEVELLHGHAVVTLPVWSTLPIELAHEPIGGVLVDVDDGDGTQRADVYDGTSGVFALEGTVRQQAIAFAGLERVMFPWERLRVLPPVTIRWGPTAPLGAAAGAFYAPTVELSSRIEADPAAAMRTLAHELGHVVDTCVLSEDERTQVRDLLEVPRTASWWAGAHDERPGERFAALFAATCAPRLNVKPYPPDVGREGALHAVLELRSRRSVVEGRRVRLLETPPNGARVLVLYRHQADVAAATNRPRVVDGNCHEPTTSARVGAHGRRHVMETAEYKPKPHAERAVVSLAGQDCFIYMGNRALREFEEMLGQPATNISQPGWKELGLLLWASLNDARRRDGTGDPLTVAEVSDLLDDTDDHEAVLSTVAHAFMIATLGRRAVDGMKNTGNGSEA